MAYKLRYSDYPGTDTGPPDPERWIGPPGPMGPAGPQGIPGPRSTDIANVLDFGADPTGAADSSAAINAAAAVAGPNGRNKTVYLPTGTYRVNHQIVLTASQGMVGDTRGSSILYVDQAFDPAATSVIFITASSYDAGPVLRDFGITFAQPSTQGSRANFKTLAAGGTSGSGGTGVQYPWAIAAGSDSFRIQVIRVRIGGAWDGITTNGHNAVYYLTDVEVGAFDCGVSLGEGASGVYDYAHITGFHFYLFDMPGSNLSNVFFDGQTIALRVGNQDGLDARGVSILAGRVVFTAAAATGWFSITNLGLDYDQATLEVSAASWLQITNMYSTSSTGALRPCVNITATAGSKVLITNAFLQSSTALPQINVTGGEVMVVESMIQQDANTASAVAVSGGTLRMNSVMLWPATGAWSAPLISQSGTGVLQLDNVDVKGTAGGSGTAVSFSVNNAANILGLVALQTGWTVVVPTGFSTTLYGNTYSTGGLFTSGGIQAGTTGGGAVNVGIVSTAGQQKALLYYRGGNIAWGILASGATDDLSIGRWNDAGSFVGTPFAINRGSGRIALAALQASTTYASDAAAAAGGVAVGELYRNGSAVMVRVA